MDASALPVFLFVAIATGMAVTILALAHAIGPKPKSTAVKLMPYESGMDPVHSARQRFNIGFYLLAIEFLVFDVELLFLYPWAVTVGGNPAERLGTEVFWCVMVFLALLLVGFAYTWRKGVFKWN
jgi:NADH:ubiquinone oxidoreductase subunit 3 (subunit A)